MIRIIISHTHTDNMVSDTIYELCEPILQDPGIAEDDWAERIEELLSKETPLKGKALEDAVLGVLWRKKSGGEENTPIRTTISRRPSPAPWQIQRSSTPSRSTSSANINPPPGLGPAPPGFKRTKSSTASPSPFGSPRPSPRLAYATPAIPHSPNLSAYQFSEASPTADNYGDFGSDNVDWLVSDDASSNTSYGDNGFSMTAGEYMQPYNVEMTPYDMLRTVLRDERSDDDLDKVLEANGYDLSQTIMALMEAEGQGLSEQQMASAMQEQNRTFLVGKSMSPSSRPLTPVGQAKSPIVCRYWLSTGHCARADCRFSHDLSNHVCKYWLAGNCLAGDSCMFSHDPSGLMSRMTLDANKNASSEADFDMQDDSFPSLQPTTSNPYDPGLDAASLGSPRTVPRAISQSTLNPFATFVPGGTPTGPRSLANSRPTSRQASRSATPSAPAFNDDEAFPTLGSAAGSKTGKRHHGKRGHGHSHKESPVPVPSSLADVVRMSPSPSPMLQTRRGLRPTKSFNSSRENGSAAQAIPSPDHIPWLEVGEASNRAYLKARGEAFRHGALRNKFLQSAAQAWHRNDARGAKALSLRGQNENTLMKEAHREAARCLYEERNKDSSSSKELYVDLHGKI